MLCNFNKASKSYFHFHTFVYIFIYKKVGIKKHYKTNFYKMVGKSGKGYLILKEFFALFWKFTGVIFYQYGTFFHLRTYAVCLWKKAVTFWQYILLIEAIMEKSKAPSFSANLKESPMLCLLACFKHPTEMFQWV